MLTYRKKAGTTSVSVVLRIVDSTDGTPETGVVFNTAGIDIQYRREGAASVAITEVTLAGLTTAWTSGGFLHIGNGYYRVDVPDAAFASGSEGVLIHGTVTGMVVIGVYVQLDVNDLADIYARIGAPTGASISADVLQVKNFVDDIGAAGVGLTAIPWNAAWDAEVQSEALDALVSYDPPTETEMNARTLVAASYATSAAQATDATATTAIKAKTDQLVFIGARVDSTVGALQTGVITATAIANNAIHSLAPSGATYVAIKDAVKAMLVDGVALDVALAYIQAFAVGVSTTGGTKFKAPDGTTDRVVYTFDASKNRTNVVRTPPP